MKICPTCQESNHDAADLCMLCGAQLPVLPEQGAPGSDQGPMLMPSAPPQPSPGTLALAVFHDTEARVVGYLPLSGDVCAIGREDAAAGLFPELDLSAVAGNGASVGYASRQHATLLRDPAGHVVLATHKRTTGTQLNRTLLQDATRTAISPGDRLILGGRVRLKLVQF
jgi:hypothetical protein